MGRVKDISVVKLIAHLRRQCHNSKRLIFSGETFKGFEVL